ncbi:MAG: 50S ribosomal protein L17 [bacterium]
MRHHIAGRKFSRTSAHRKAMYINLATSLFKYERIKTTTPKAKELRCVAEKLITLGKKGDLSARRKVLRAIKDQTVVKKLFDQIAPKFLNRPGGYTRILKLEPKRLDGAQMAIIELVENIDREEEIQMKEDKIAKKKKDKMKDKKE